MPRTNYQKGSDKERRVVNFYRARGEIALRSAGSHSPIDVVAINPELKFIRLIQVKLRGEKNLSKGELAKIKLDGSMLDGTYKVVFQLVT